MCCVLGWVKNKQTNKKEKQKKKKRKQKEAKSLADQTWQLRQEITVAKSNQLTLRSLKRAKRFAACTVNCLGQKEPQGFSGQVQRNSLSYMQNVLGIKEKGPLSINTCLLSLDMGICCPVQSTSDNITLISFGDLTFLSCVLSQRIASQGDLVGSHQGTGVA